MPNVCVRKVMCKVSNNLQPTFHTSLQFPTYELTFCSNETQVEDHEREVARLVGLLEGERREKEEEAQVFHKKVNMALTHDHDYLLAGGMTIDDMHLSH